MTFEPLPASDLFGLECGPSYCSVCGEWPASMTPKGKRCHLCWTRDIAAENPVPLPNNKQCLEDLASIGVPGAAEKLAALWPNTQAMAPPNNQRLTIMPDDNQQHGDQRLPSAHGSADFCVAAMQKLPPLDLSWNLELQRSWWIIAESILDLMRIPPPPTKREIPFTYQSTQATECAVCGQRKHTPLRRDEMGGYVCMTCIDKRLDEWPNVTAQASGPAPSDSAS